MQAVRTGKLTLKWHSTKTLTKPKSTLTPILGLFFLPCKRKDV